MINFDYKALFGKLNDTCIATLGAANAVCTNQQHDWIELTHLLFAMLEPATGEVPTVLKHYQVSVPQLRLELRKAFEKIPRGKGGKAGFSREIETLVRESWMLTSIRYKYPKVRSGIMLTTMLVDRDFSTLIRDACPELKKILADTLLNELPTLIAGSPEDVAPPTETPGVATSAPADSKNPALDQFTSDLTAQARAGKIDPVVGRDYEIRQVIDILTRRRQNNPILTGEAGVGKTAVVEGFALRVAARDVPESLKNVSIRVLDLALLQAGAGVKGEFENRLKNVLSEVKASPTPIILFIDEAHTMIGAGGQAGQGDAANLLKPALARGELRTIAATTWAEYKKYFEEDAALKRRFQVVKVAEPELDNASRMIRGLTAMLEHHHKVRILEEAVEDSVRLSARYITDRQLPDKAVSLLDTACARVALSQTATPPAIEDCTRDIELTRAEIEILQREQAVGADHKDRLADLAERQVASEKRKVALEEQLKKEQEIVKVIREIHGKLEAHMLAEGKADKAADRLTPADEAKLQADLVSKDKELSEVQGETPLIQPFVSSQAIAEVVSAWTGIPLGKMVLNEIRTVMHLQETLGERVIGQSFALNSIAQRIQTARANLADPRRPLGVFMLVGPSGVGKTETAMALADVLYGGDRNMVIINMSEYKESHKISNLVGSSKGLVGYGTGGVLTEAVRRKPYSVVLLDEIEKAHVDVQELFYQVFDKGMLQDSSGNEVNFKNTIILLTSNVGTDTIMKVTADPDTSPDPAGLAATLRPDLLKAFKPAFLGRCDVVPYYPLGDEVLKKIIRLKLAQVAGRVRDNHKATFEYDDKLVDTVASRCKEVESGARNVDHILTGSLLPELAREFLENMADGRSISRVSVGIDDKGGFKYTIA